MKYLLPVMAFLLLNAAGVSYFFLSSDVERDVALQLPTAIELGSVPAADRTIFIPITNSNLKPRRIIGLAEG